MKMGKFKDGDIVKILSKDEVIGKYLQCEWEYEEDIYKSRLLELLKRGGLDLDLFLNKYIGKTLHVSRVGKFCKTIHNLDDMDLVYIKELDYRGISPLCLVKVDDYEVDLL